MAEASTLGERHRDPSRDVVPLVAAMAVAWWTTVRPAGFFPGAAWPQRATAGLAIVGVIAATWTLMRGARHLVTVVLAGFLFPCAITWLIGPEAATALSEPIEVFVGAIAWTTLGVLLIRPSAVAIPRGSEGGGGPTIGASDDVARMAIKELDAALVKEEPPPKLTPRTTMPRWASLPLYLGAALAAAVALQIVRVGSNLPDRAVLARMVGAACAIALLSTAGDLVEVRYQSRRVPKARTRLQRAGRAIVGLAVLAFVYFVLIGRDR
jgi:hypothetical protein